MRRAARIAGLAWVALLAVGGAALWVSETMVWRSASSNRGLIYMIFGGAVPGLLLYRWGRGPHQPPPSAREIVAKAYPSRTAQEMGHVMHIKDEL